MPALAVRIAGPDRSGSRGGCTRRLAAAPDRRRGLPTLLTPCSHRRLRPGKPWTDDAVKRAVELVEAHHPKNAGEDAAGLAIDDERREGAGGREVTLSCLRCNSSSTNCDHVSNSSASATSSTSGAKPDVRQRLFAGTDARFVQLEEVDDAEVHAADRRAVVVDEPEEVFRPAALDGHFLAHLAAHARGVEVARRPRASSSLMCPPMPTDAERLKARLGARRTAAVVEQVARRTAARRTG